MNVIKQTDREYKTPEEAFDRVMVSGGYRMFLLVVMFFMVGVELFVGLMPVEGCIGVAIFAASLLVGLVAGPLFWETNANYKAARRIRRAVYFPIRKSAFLLSKIKIMGEYVAVRWVIALVVQLAGAPLFGAGNILLYQGVLLAAAVVNILFYCFIGTVGAGLGE
ncbi:MAG: hypothetical protein J6J42_08115 [Lachnospiraceae bacterium]|nr:hypothetical protein [Lachnospiraceae bacterium]